MDKVIIGQNKFNTLVAITESERVTGLMYKKWPPPIMCFPFQTKEIRKFWMRNTISPLDILFCNGGQIINIYHGDPLSLKLIGPNEVTDLVVELPHGTVEKYNISTGTSVDIIYSIDTLSKKYLEKLSHIEK